MVFREVRISIEVIAVSRVSINICWFVCSSAIVISEIKNRAHNSHKSVDKLLMEIDETKEDL